MRTNKRYTSDPKKFQFTVIQLNVLANECADQDPKSGFPLVDKDILPLANRKQYIVGALTGADLVCLEEIEPHQWEFDNDFCGIFNHTCFCARNTHGVALMWKKDRFRKIAELTTALDNTNQVMVAVMLEYTDVQENNVEKTRKLLFVGTHLKHGEECNDVRVAQVLAMKRHLLQFMMEADHAILCGDLNCGPDERPHKLLEIDFFDPFNNPSETVEFHKMPLRLPTTLKYRCKGDSSIPEKICKTEDYMMLSHSYNVHIVNANVCPNILKHREDENSTYRGYPFKQWHSDHCALVLRLEVDKEFDRDHEDYDYFADEEKKHTRTVDEFVLRHL